MLASHMVPWFFGSFFSTCENSRPHSQLMWFPVYLVLQGNQRTREPNGQGRNNLVGQNKPRSLRSLGRTNTAARTREPNDWERQGKSGGVGDQPKMITSQILSPNSCEYRLWAGTLVFGRAWPKHPRASKMPPRASKMPPRRLLDASC